MAWSADPRNTNPQPKLPPIGRGTVILSVIAVLILVISWQQGRFGIIQVYFFIALVPSVVLHEVSHGALANLFGDDTAKRAGRLTLNPLRHVDPWFTFIIPAILIISFGIGFGGAKPVPVNTSGMSRNKAMFTGLVGPAVNIALAVLAAVLYNTFWNGTGDGWMLGFIYAFGAANVILAAFNLLPIPPLDGSSVIERFLPNRYWPQYLKFRNYAFFILLGIMLLAGNLLFENVFEPAIDFWEEFLPRPSFIFI